MFFRRTVFVSYRRTDGGGLLDLLCHRLAEDLGKQRVLRDTGFQGGEKYLERIRRDIAKSDAVLAIIGKGWLSEIPRLSDKNDVLCGELKQALDDKKTLIPIAFEIELRELPKVEQLPDGLAPILDYEALRLRSGTDFAADYVRIAQALGISRGGAGNAAWWFAIAAFAIASTVGIWALTPSTTGTPGSGGSSPVQMAPAAGSAGATVVVASGGSGGTSSKPDRRPKVAGGSSARDHSAPPAKQPSGDDRTFVCPHDWDTNCKIITSGWIDSVPECGQPGKFAMSCTRELVNGRQTCTPSGTMRERKCGP